MLLEWKILAENNEFLLINLAKVCKLVRKIPKQRILFSLVDYSAIEGIAFDIDHLESLKILFSLARYE